MTDELAARGMTSPTQFTLSDILPTPTAEARCAICGGYCDLTIRADKRIGSSFTNWDSLHDSDYLCAACEFFMQGKNTILQELLGRDKPQRPINYSWIKKDGKLHILSKGQKSAIAALLHNSVPELAAIAESGQKHTVFFARVNEGGQPAGWVTFEQQTFWFECQTYSAILVAVEALYNDGHSKQHILHNSYRFYPDMDKMLWQRCEAVIAPYRRTPLLELCIYLAQKEADDV